MGTEPNAQNNTSTEQNNTAEQVKETKQVEIDYEKLAAVVEGKQKVTEDTVIKNFLRQQGLSGDELKQAVEVYKAEKAKNTPDVSALQTQTQEAQKAASAAQKAAMDAQIQAAATMEAVSLGIDAQTIPYMLKLADFTGAVDDKGQINKETVKAALSKVLEDIPRLKVSEENKPGFRIGGGAERNQSDNTTQKRGVPSKRWNKFNY